MTTTSKPALRIAMATPRFFPLAGGVENHVYQVASRLNHQGMEVTVLTVDPTGEMPASETINGIQVMRVKGWPQNRDFGFAPGLYRLVAEGGWQLLHVQSYHTFVPFFAMAAARHARIPYVVTFHGGGHSSPLRNLARVPQRALLRPFLARAARLVAVARFEIDVYGRELRLPPEHFTLIPNGADLPQAPSPTAGDESQILILSVGRLEKYKGHQRAIAALPHLLEREPRVKLRIAGSGPYAEALQQLARDLNVAAQVEIGAVPPERREEMAQLVSRAALVVLLSDFETHPIAALEALALHRPVLVANNSGMKELADQGWARAIQTDSSPADTAEAMLAQIRNPYQPAEMHLPTWDECADGLASLYRGILGNSAESQK